MSHSATVAAAMQHEPLCILRITAGARKGQLIGPFDLPAEAASYGLAELGLHDGQFTLSSLYPPESSGPRPTLRVLAGADDAA